MRTTTVFFAASLSFAPQLLGCDDEFDHIQEPEPPGRQADDQVDDHAAVPAAEMPAEAPVATAADEACAQVLVVAWDGAQYASDAIDRSQEDARARAEGLWGQLEGGADFAELARTESDAASTGPRGGLMGTYARDEWPAPHAAIQDTVFGLAVGQTSQVVEAPYGYVVARRCPVEKIHTRHILVRYQGARNAADDVVRGKEAARALAEEIHSAVIQEGADFAEIARLRSEDASAERGGDLGEVGRGRLAPEYEQAAFELQPQQIADLVETEFGFHVIQRLE